MLVQRAAASSLIAVCRPALKRLMPLLNSSTLLQAHSCVFEHIQTELRSEHVRIDSRRDVARSPAFTSTCLNCDLQARSSQQTVSDGAMCRTNTTPYVTAPGCRAWDCGRSLWCASLESWQHPAKPTFVAPWATCDIRCMQALQLAVIIYGITFVTLHGDLSAGAACAELHPSGQRSLHSERPASAGQMCAPCIAFA